MKKKYVALKPSVYFLITFLVFSVNLSIAQLAPPQGINYQAIARDTTGNPFITSALDVTVSIYDSLTGGAQLFQENHPSIQTNLFGLFTLEIGSQNNSQFQTIPWANGEKYLEIELSISGSTPVTLPRNKLNSVPYSLYSKNSANAINADNAWKLNGNNIADSMFLGTKNNKSLSLKTNDTTRLKVSSDGKVAIGKVNSTITHTLEITDSLNLNNGTTLSIIKNNAASSGSLLELNAAAGGDTAQTGLVIYEPNGKFIQGWMNSIKVFEIGIGGKSFFGDSVGIGTATPAAKLDVIGQIKITDGSEGAGKILSSDANGLATWIPLSNGTVTSFSSGDLAPLFTTSVSNDTSAPNLSFNLTTAPSYSIFGNNTSTSAQPTYFNPMLSSSLFENQGTQQTVLHGNASGDPFWGQIINADIANGTIDLVTKVNGILPILNGGTNTNIIGANGTIPYSNGAAYNFTSAGTTGQVLTSTGTGAPVWTTRTISGIYPIHALTNDNGISYDISIDTNSQTAPGVVAPGNGFNNMVWKTDSQGNPAWRNDSAMTNTQTNAGLVTAGGGFPNKVWKTDGSGNPFWANDSSNSYTSGTGITIGLGNSINSVWTENAGNIYNNNIGNVGIGITTPSSKLDVLNDSSNGAAGSFYNTSLTNTNPALIGKNSGQGTAISAINSGTGNAGTFEITGNLNTSNSLTSTTAGSGGHAGDFSTTNSANSASVLQASTLGTGKVADFINTNSSNSSSTVNITTNGANASALNVSNTGAGTTNYGIYSVSAGSGAGTTNIASYFNAINGSNNYAAIFDQGNVGVGTITPTNKLEVKNTANNYSAGYFENTSTSNGSTALVAKSNSSGNALFVSTTGLGNAAIINTTNTSNSQDILQINTVGAGSKGLTINHTGTGAIDYGTYVLNTGGGTTNVASYFSASGATNNYAGIFANGYVGIGTNTPLAPLHLVYNTPNPLISGMIINNTDATNNAITSLKLINDIGLTGGISMNSSTNTTFAGVNGMIIGTNGASKLQLGTNNAPRMTVDTNGNVGIATTTPTSPLTIQTKSGTELEFVMAGGTNADISANSQLNIGTTGTSLNFLTAGSTRMLINSSGNIGVGNVATPASLFHVGGQIRTGLASSVNGSLVFNDSINANTITIKSGITSSSYTLTLPATQGAVNSILFNNGSGSLSWVTATAIGWSNLGNSGTNAAVNFIGTTDSVDFIAKTNSNERLRITGNGKIGIGTNAPTSKLTVNYTGGTESPLLISTSGAGNTLNLTADHRFVYGPTVTTSGTGADLFNIGNNAATVQTGASFVVINPASVDAASALLNVQEGGVTRLVVDGTGKVGIGTTAPASLFHSAGQIRTGIPLGGLGGATATNGSILFYNAINTNTIAINSDTTSSSYTLTLPKSQGTVNSILFNNGSGNLSWVAATAIGWSNLGNSGTNAALNFIGTTDSVAFVAKTNNNERLRITGAGNVGIGTASPANKLHVFGGSTILDPNSGTSTALTIKGDQSAISHIASDGTFKWNSGLRDDNGGALDNFAFVNTTGTAMVITQAGLVGIGTTTPTSRLDVEGGVAIGSTYSGTNAAPTNGAIIEGNVGIGTTTPASKLDIEGGISIGASYSGTATAPTNGAIIEGNVGIGTTSPSTNTRLAIKDGHLQSLQTSSPTVSSASIFTLGSQTLLNATDVAGNISIVPAFNVSGSVTIAFNKTYATAPIIVLTSTNANAASDISKVWVTSSTNGFTINFNATFDTSAHTFNYHVIETQ